MAAGKPVIATDGGGTRELVADGVTGYLVPQKSPELLAERIEHLLGDDGLREKMGIEGRERILREFNIGRMVEEHSSLYEELIS
jgi:glycosyltransferase involved in cell wall biosynthesis